MPTIQIKPFDTLFFRDGKPFSMGDDVWATGVFPPNPSTIYGALRASYFADNLLILENANIEGKDSSLNLHVRKLLYSDNESYMVPVPLDLVSEKDKNVAYVLSLKSYENRISSSPFKETLSYTGTDIVESLEGNYLSFTDLQSYLNNESNQFPYIKSQTLYGQEPKIGIARNAISKTSEDGRIYRVAMIRSKDDKNFNIIVEYENLKFNQKGNFKLGADGKLIHYDSITNFEIKPPQNLTNRFKLYLLTPSIFKTGWLPFGLSSNQLETEYEGIKLKLLTCVVGKYNNIGGFQYKDKEGKQFPKPMYRAVPSGSVYYFESDCNDPQKIIDLFHNKSISDTNKKEGYGITFVGKV